MMAASRAAWSSNVMPDHDLTTWCGPIAKLPTDRFAAALPVALALREQLSQERLSFEGLRLHITAQYTPLRFQPDTSEGCLTSK